ncbi:flavodoxin [bacterium D16-76]|nr:flavodoxin [bacterium D16-76]
MKKIIPLLLAFMLVLAACGDSGAGNSSAPSTPSLVVSDSQELSSAPESSESSAPVSSEGQASSEAEASSEHILIAYFTMPEDVDTAGVDAISGASIMMRDGMKLGSCEFVAKTVQETIGGDLFQIEAVQQYPLDHDPLVDQAADEKAQEVRPELAARLENIDQYDTIILGYPNWWADLPMPVYTFLEEYDFVGKTIIPFVTHGGSGFSATVGTIAALQPGAAVSENTLSIARGDVVNCEETVIDWANGLGLG